MQRRHITSIVLILVPVLLTAVFGAGRPDSISLAAVDALEFTSEDRAPEPDLNSVDDSTTTTSLDESGDGDGNTSSSLGDAGEPGPDGSTPTSGGNSATGGADKTPGGSGGTAGAGAGGSATTTTAKKPAAGGGAAADDGSACGKGEAQITVKMTGGRLVATVTNTMSRDIKVKDIFYVVIYTSGDFSMVFFDVPANEMKPGDKKDFSSRAFRTKGEIEGIEQINFEYYSKNKGGNYDQENCTKYGF